MIIIKKKTPIISVVLIAGMIIFGKYALIFLGIAVLIILICLAVSYNNNKSSTYQTASKSSSGLNYKPLTKSEISGFKPRDIPPLKNDVVLTPIPPSPSELIAPKEVTVTIEHSEVVDENIKECAVSTPTGFVSAQKVTFDKKNVQKLCEKYIAFDVETTGLSPYNDRIVEVGAVIFKNKVPVKSFGSLVNPNRLISPSVTKINHITNEMLAAAPSEEEVYSKLYDFMKEAMDGQAIVCAHNAKFDMDFLSETFKRLGYNAEILYTDTLYISRSLVPDLDNHKQPTVAAYFGIVNENAHRAESDAEVCGKILACLLDMKQAEYAYKEKLREEAKAAKRSNVK